MYEGRKKASTIPPTKANVEGTQKARDSLLLPPFY